MDTIHPSLPHLLDEVIFRQAASSDLPALEWHGQFTHFRRVYKENYQRSLKGKTILWVADHRVIGIIGQVFIQLTGGRKELSDGKHRAYVFSVRIKPAFRSRGLGKRFMEYVEKDLLDRGFRKVILNVAKDNPGARKFYDNLGYVIVANEPGEWSYIDHQGKMRDIHEPAWRMEKHINGG